MDPKIVREAKEIPVKLKQVMNDMFERSEPTLRAGVSALRQTLQKLDGYLHEVEKEHLAGAARRGTARAVRPQGGPRRGRRGKRRFATAQFIVAELSKSEKELRPVELAERLAEATGRDKSATLGQVNTTLSRLVKAKTVVRHQGTYSVGSAKPAARAKSTRRSGRKATATPPSA